MDRTYIGADLGTSGVKLLLTDSRGRILAQSSREYEASRPHAGWSEIDPRIWYRETIEGLKQLLKGQDPGRVSVIGVTGQMHTLVLLDGKGESVRPAMMWNDKRTAGLIPELRRVLAGGPDGDYLSRIVSTGSPAANLYWVSREEPDAFSRIARFLIGPDYLVYRLTGNAGTDYADASTSSMYCIHRRAWSGEILGLTGLPESACPPVRGSAETAGTLLPDVARSLGLPESTWVITGTGDNPAAAVSTGCVGGGYPVLSLGTSGVLVFRADDMKKAPKGKAILCSHDGKTFFYLIQGVVQSTGECMNWWTRDILGTRDFRALEETAGTETARRTEVLFYPHINGDKTIYADPGLRGAFIGLSRETTRGEMHFAVMEGICFAVRQMAEATGLDLNGMPSLKVVGGGSGSDLWLQTLANALHIPVERLGDTAGAASGITMLARAADRGGDFRPGDLADGIPGVEKVFSPEPETAALYEERYARYLRIHDAIKFINGE